MAPVLPRRGTSKGQLMCASPASGIKPGSIHFVFTIPARWPPAHSEEFISEIKVGTKTTITAHEDGHISLTIHASGQSVEHHFQRIRLSGEGRRSILQLTWGNDGPPSCLINGQELRLRESNLDEILDLTYEPVIVQQTTGTHFSQAALDRMPELERFFLHTLHDIEQKLTANDSYALTRLSGLIRHLLLDGRPLLDQVNAIYRLRLRFPVIAGLKSPAHDQLHDLLNDGQTILHRAGLFPNGAPSTEITKDEFLKFECLLYRGIDITVRDVVLTVAHILGGIHTDEPKDEVQETLLRLEREVTTSRSPILLYAMTDIARVVYAAVTPLVHEIYKRHGA